MGNSSNTDEQPTFRGRVLMSISAFLLALPNGAMTWFIIMYPVFGITGVLMHPYIHFATLLMASLFLFGWSVYGSLGVADVVYRSCRFGMLLALLLPVVTGMISLMWAFQVVERPPPVLPGFSMLEIPVHASTAALMLILLFLAGSYLAARKLDNVPF